MSNKFSLCPFSHMNYLEINSWLVIFTYKMFHNSFKISPCLPLYTLYIMLWRSVESVLLVLKGRRLPSFFEGFIYYLCGFSYLCECPVDFFKEIVYCGYTILKALFRSFCEVIYNADSKTVVQSLINFSKFIIGLFNYIINYFYVKLIRNIENLLIYK